jgi:phospholipase C
MTARSLRALALPFFANCPAVILGCATDDATVAPAPAADSGVAEASAPEASPCPPDKLPPAIDAGSADGTSADAARGEGASLSSIQHVVVLYLENHSFDNLFGSWPGADGAETAPGTAIVQVGPDGRPYKTLPQYAPFPPGVASLVDAKVPNRPFDLTQYAVSEGALTNDLLHRFYQEQSQIHGGRMDSFVLYNDESAGESMGYWPTATLPIPIWMKQHPRDTTLCDHFFHAAFGGSFLNHFWLIAARTPVYENAPNGEFGVVVQLGPDQQLPKVLDTASLPARQVYNTNGGDNEVTPDGYAVNTAYSVNEPHPRTFDPGAGVPNLLPQQTFPTIADALDANGVSWAWYAGGWNAALAAAGLGAVGTCSGSEVVPDGGPTFQYHHQPFVYFKNWGGNANDGGVGNKPPNGKWAVNQNLKDELDFLNEVNRGLLPAVSFVKPLYDEHPNYTTETSSENHAVEILNALVASSLYPSTVVLVTYDENGGFWDHVAPPKTDRWGPGTRVPLIVVSPFAKGGIDKTVYDTTAILRLIERRWGLPPLTSRDQGQKDLASHALKLAP